VRTEPTERLACFNHRLPKIFSRSFQLALFAAQLFDQPSISLRRPLVLTAAFDLVKLLSQSVLLVIHLLTIEAMPKVFRLLAAATIGIRKALELILYELAAARLLHGVFKLVTEIDAHLPRALLCPQTHIAGVPIERFITRAARIEGIEPRSLGLNHRKGRQHTVGSR